MYLIHKTMHVEPEQCFRDPGVGVMENGMLDPASLFSTLPLDGNLDVGDGTIDMDLRRTKSGRSSTRGNLRSGIIHSHSSWTKVLPNVESISRNLMMFLYAPTLANVCWQCLKPTLGCG